MQFRLCLLSDRQCVLSGSEPILDLRKKLCFSCHMYEIRRHYMQEVILESVLEIKKT